MRLPVTLSLRYSRYLAAALLAAHLIAGVGLAATILPLAAKFAVWSALLLSLAMALRPAKAACLTLRSDGLLDLIDRHGLAVECSVHPASTVFPWLVVLLLRNGRHTRALTLPVDALGADGHRQLRLWLKWKATAGKA